MSQNRVQFVRHMNSQSSSLLVQDNDAKLWVLKPVNRLLDAAASAREVMGSVLCSTLGLPVPSFRIFQIDQGSWSACARTSGIATVPPSLVSGLHFASRFIPDSSGKTVVELIPASIAHSIRWETDALGMFLFDLWAGQCRRRRILFTLAGDGMRPVFVNHRHLFGDRSSSVELPISGSLFQRNALACWRKDKAAGAKWIKRIQHLVPKALEVGCARVPSLWRTKELDQLLLLYLERLPTLGSVAEQVFSSLESLMDRQDRFFVS